MPFWRGYWFADGNHGQKNKLPRWFELRVLEKNCSTNSKLLRFVVDIKHRFALAATPRVLMVTISRTGY